MSEHYDVIIDNILFIRNKNFQAKTKTIYLLVQKTFVCYLINCLSFSAENKNIDFLHTKPAKIPNLEI